MSRQSCMAIQHRCKPGLCILKERPSEEIGGCNSQRCGSNPQPYKKRRAKRRLWQYGTQRPRIKEAHDAAETPLDLDVGATEERCSSHAKEAAATKTAGCRGLPDPSHTAPHCHAAKLSSSPEPPDTIEVRPDDPQAEFVSAAEVTPAAMAAALDRCRSVMTCIVKETP